MAVLLRRCLIKDSLGAAALTAVSFPVGLQESGPIKAGPKPSGAVVEDASVQQAIVHRRRKKIWSDCLSSIGFIVASFPVLALGSDWALGWGIRGVGDISRPINGYSGYAGPCPAQNWYYCHNPPGYYPYADQCHGPWQMVPAS